MTYVYLVCHVQVSECGEWLPVFLFSVRQYLNSLKYTTLTWDIFDTQYNEIKGKIIVNRNNNKLTAVTMTNAKQVTIGNCVYRK